MVSPRKITKSRKRHRFTNSFLIPKERRLLNRLNNLTKCSVCSRFLLAHFDCKVCLEKKLKSRMKDKNV